MVAFVGGAGLGLFNTSLNVVGDAAARGNSLTGRSAENLFVNTTNGNLVVQRQDEFLTAIGADIPIFRTYNSQGLMNDDNGDNWRMGVAKTLGGLTGTLNSSGTITRTDGDGFAAVYTYSGSSYVNTDGAGSYDTLAYNSSTSTWTWTDGDSGTQETYDWVGGAGKITKSIDKNLNQTTFGYTGALVTSVLSSTGESTYLTYTGANQLQEMHVVRADSTTAQRIRYAYDGSNRLSVVTVDLSPEDNSIADGKTYITNYGYDAGGRVNSITQTDGTSVSIGYTSAVVGGQTVYRVSSLAQTVSTGVTRTTGIVYDDAAHMTTVTDPLGGLTKFTCDASGQVTKIVDPAVTGGVAQTVDFTYDSWGNVLTAKDAQQNTRTFTYDPNKGTQLTAMDAAGNTVTRTYDGNNQLLTRTLYTSPDPDGTAALTASGPLTTRNAYDVRSNLRFSVSPDGRVTEYRYSAAGLVQSVYQYTADLYTGTVSESALATWVSGLADKTRAVRVDNTYDFRGNLQTSTKFTTIDSTGAGVADATKSTATYVYDPSGQLKQTISSNGNATTGISTDGITNYVYDGLWRMTSSTDALGYQTTTTYTDGINQTVITCANGLKTTSTFNNAGELISLLQANGGTSIGTTSYWYDGNGRARMTQDPNGVKSHSFYDEAGRKVLDVDGTGTVREYLYNQNNRVISTITYYNAATVALVDGSGNPASVTIAQVRPTASSTYDRKVWNFYDTADRLVKSVDELGYITETKYDGASRATDTYRYANKYTGAAITTATLPGAVVPSAYDSSNDRRTQFTYDGEGRLINRVDGENYTIHNDYDAAGRPVHTVAYKAGTTSDAANDRHTWTLYDAQNRVVGTVNPEGFLTENTFDNSGNLLTQSRYSNKAQLDPAVITTAATMANLRPTVSAGNDRTTTWTYTDRNQVNTTTDAEGTVTKYTYNSVGSVTQTERGYGTSELRTTQTQYDVRSNVIAEISGENGTTNHVYDAAGRRISSTDANNLKTLFYYDNEGKLVYTVNSFGEVAQNTYNLLDQLTQTKRYGNRIASGTLASMTGGLASAVVGTVTGLADVTKDSKVDLGYDLHGQLNSRTDELNLNSTALYNAFGEIYQSTDRIDAGNSTVTQYAYDRRGLRKQTIEDLGGLARSTGATYDAFGRLSSTTDGRALTSTYSYAYDTVGRKVTVQDPSPLGFQTVTTYDAFDRVVTQKDRNNNTVTTSYNDATRSMTVTTAEGVSVITARSRHGQVVTVKDGNSNLTTYTYDRNGNLKTRVNSGLAVTEVVNNYDAGNRIIDTTDANGVKTTFTYNAAGRLFTRSVDPTGLNLQTTYTYEAAGRVLTVTDPNGTVTQNTYDLKGQLSLVQVDPAGLNLRTGYSYDARGKTLTVTQGQGGANPIVTQYTYDKLGRRTKEQVNPAGLNLTTQYQYDANDNLTAKIDGNNNVTRYVYDADNRLTYQLDALNGLAAYLYDSAGRVAQATTYAGKLATASIPANVTTVLTAANITSALTGIPDATRDMVVYKAYDKDGRQTWQADGTGAVTTWQYDKNGNVIDKRAYATRLGAIASRALPVESLANDVHTRILYDAGNRATKTAVAQWVNGGQLYWAISVKTYDNAGNLTSRTRHATARSSQTLAANPTQSDVDTWMSGVTISASIDALDRRVYDAAGRLVYSIDPMNAVAKTSYDRAGNVVQTTTYANPITVSGNAPSLTAVGNAIVANSVVDRGTWYVRDAAGRATYEVDALGALVENAYDSTGRRTTRTAYANKLSSSLPANPTLADVVARRTLNSANDRVERTVFDAAGRAVYAIDAKYYVKETKYDAASRVSSRIQYNAAISSGTTMTQTGVQAVLPGTPGSLDRKTGFGYDVANNLTSTTDALNLAESYGYDGQHNKTTFTNKALTVWDYEYDQAGRIKAQVDPAITINRLTVTAGVPSMASVPGVRVRTETTYDAFGNVAARKEAAGLTEERSTVYEYDAAGRQVRTTFPTIGVFDAAVGADANGRTESGKTPMTAVSYDALGNAVVNQDAGGKYSYRVYNSAGQLRYEIDAAGYVTGYARDAFGAVTAVTRYAQLVTVSPPGQPVALATMATLLVTGPSDRTITTQYDMRGRVTKVSEPLASDVYDPAHAPGNVLAVGKVTATVYNAFGDVLKLSVFGADVSGAMYVQPADTFYTFNTLGQRVAEMVAKDKSFGATWANAYLSEVAYDSFGNVTSRIEHANTIVLSDLNFNAAAGMPPVTPAASTDNREMRYTYDAVNNKLTETRYGVTYSNTADAATPTTGNVTTTFAYDALGNQISTTDAVGNTTFTYRDVLGRVTAVATLPLQQKRTQIGQLYLGILNRMPTPAEMTTAMGQGPDDLATTLYNSATAISLRSGGDPDGALITNLYQFLLARAPESAAAITYWKGQIPGSDTAAHVTMIMKFIAGVSNGMNEDTVVMNSKVGAGLAGQDMAVAAAAGKRRVQIAQLYFTIFGRAPDPGGLSYYANMSLPIEDMAQIFFVNSAEGQNLFPATCSDVEIVSRLFQSVYNRPPSSGEIDFWLNDLKDDRLLSNPMGKFITHLITSLTNSGVNSVELQMFSNKCTAGLADSMDVNSMPAPLSEFTLDAYGSAIRRTDYASGARFATSSNYGVWTSTDDRKNYTLYDKSGRALQVVDAEGKSAFTSYDVYGNVAKSWRPVTINGPVQTAYEKRQYDTIGRATQVDQSGSVQNITYNAFGEVLTRAIGADNPFEVNEYDNAGRVWRTTAGDGIKKVALYDIMGRQTVDLRSGTTDVGGYATAVDAYLATGLVRTDSRYDFLGNQVTVTGATQYASNVGTVEGVAMPPRVALGGGVVNATLNNSNSATLSWPALTGLGAGDVRVNFEFQVYDRFTGAEAPASLVRDYPADQATTGVTLTWGGYLNAFNVTHIKVSKQNLAGDWVVVVDSDPGAYSNFLRIQSQAEPNTQYGLFYRTVGSQAWTVASDALLPNMGDAFLFNLNSLPQGNYEYQLWTRQLPNLNYSAMPDSGTFTAPTPGTNSPAPTLSSASGTANPVGVRPSTTRTFDRWGNVKTETDPFNAITTYDYNALNQRTKLTDALGGIYQTFYDFAGRQVADKDANNNVNGKVYDAVGNLVEELHADGGTVQYNVDAFGQRVRTRQANGALTSFTFDHLGRMLTNTLAPGINVVIYQNNGAVTGSTPLVAAPTTALTETYNYDEMGRRVQVKNAANEITKTIYDLRGNITKTIDGLNYETSYTWDSYNRKTGEIQADTRVRSWSYDIYGRLQSNYDLALSGAGVRHDYVYNKLGQLSSETSSVGRSLAYTYENASSLLVKIEDSSVAGSKQLTQYAYDLAGRRTREKTSVIDTTSSAETDVTQDNHIVWDKLGRMTDVQNARQSVHYEFDSVGNRVRIKTHYYANGVFNGTGASTATDIDNWNKYDGMNRQIVVDGVKDVNGNIDIGVNGGTAAGQRVVYDSAGNRIMMRTYGKRLVVSSVEDGNTGVFTDSWSTADGYYTENYAYDATGRLTDTYRDGVNIDARRYDAAGRVLQVGFWMANSSPGLATAMGQIGESSDYRVNKYDAAGRLTNQSLRDAAGVSKNDLSYTYDGGGRMSSYVLNGGGSTTTYTNAFNSGDVTRTDSMTANRNGVVGVTYNNYDKNGFITGITTSGAADSASTRTLSNDAQGRVLRKSQVGHNTYSMIANGELIGSSSDTTAPVQDTFKSNYVPISSETLSQGPSAYTVQAGDTLQSIAKNVWGNANLWYLIADANGKTTVSSGEVITIPGKTNTLTNDYQSFTPYSQGKAVGDTTPNLIIPPPKKKSSWFKQLVSIVISIVVSVMTGGAALGMLLGNLAGQASRIAMGIQDGFSWKNAAMSMIGGAVSSFIPVDVGAAIGVTSSTGQAIVQAGLSNAITQGIGVVTGLQKSFDWRGVAASAAGAGIGQSVGGALKNTDFGFGQFGNQLARGTLTGLAAGTTAAVMRGGRIAVQQIATDAFGNALGESLASAGSSTSGSGGEAWAADIAERKRSLDPLGLKAYASDAAGVIRSAQTLWAPAEARSPILSDTSTNAEVVESQWRGDYPGSDLVPTGAGNVRISSGAGGRAMVNGVSVNERAERALQSAGDLAGMGELYRDYTLLGGLMSELQQKATLDKLKGAVQEKLGVMRVLPSPDALGAVPGIGSDGSVRYNNADLIDRYGDALRKVEMWKQGIIELDTRSMLITSVGTAKLSPAEWVAENTRRYANAFATGIDEGQRRYDAGSLRYPQDMPGQLQVGSFADNAARVAVIAYNRSIGVPEGPGQLLSMNRWSYDPSGSGAYNRIDLLMDLGPSRNNGALILRTAIEGKSTLAAVQSSAAQLQRVYEWNTPNVITVTRQGALPWTPAQPKRLR